jgi:hypothetical protein
VKRLSVTRIDTTDLEPYDGSLAGSLPADADLGQALALLLSSDDDRVEVRGADGTRLGTLTVPGLLAQARR